MENKLERYWPLSLRILLGIGMLVALFTVHLSQGFSFIHIKGMTPEGTPQFGMPGIEVNLLYLAGLIALLIGGSGPLSVDERVLRPESKVRPPWLLYREVRAYPRAPTDAPRPAPPAARAARPVR